LECPDNNLDATTSGLTVVSVVTLVYSNGSAVIRCSFHPSVLPRIIGPTDKFAVFGIFRTGHLSVLFNPTIPDSSDFLRKKQAVWI